MGLISELQYNQHFMPVVAIAYQISYDIFSSENPVKPHQYVEIFYIKHLVYTPTFLLWSVERRDDVKVRVLQSPGRILNSTCVASLSRDM